MTKGHSMMQQVQGESAIYGRRSKDLDQLGKNVASQVRDMHKLADQYCCTISEHMVFVDNDVSASRFARKKRTEWLQLREAIAAGNCQNIFTLWLNRLLRMPGELEQLIDEAQAGRFNCIITESMTLDLRDPNQQMMARQMAAQAALEVELLSARVKRRKNVDREEGKATGGVVSLGWLGTRHGHSNDNGDTLHLGEATLLRDAAQRVLAGSTCSSIAAEWNTNNVPMPLHHHQAVKNGTEVPAPKWKAGHIRHQLTLARNAGYQEHNGVVVGQPWPAILDADTWQQLQRHFTARAYGPRAARASRWTGFVRCAGTMPDGSLCGKTMAYTQPKGSRPGNFRCTKAVGMDHCTLANNVVEHHVQAAAYKWLPAFLDDHAVASMVCSDDDNSEEVFAELQQLNAAMADLDALVGLGKMKPEAYARATEANTKRVADLSRSLARTPVRKVVAQYVGRGSLVASLLADDVLTASEHRALFASTGRYLWVKPAGGRGPFQPSRISFGADVQAALHSEQRAA